jgi:hypothetical protein
MTDKHNKVCFDIIKVDFRLTSKGRNETNYTTVKNFDLSKFTELLNRGMI